MKKIILILLIIGGIGSPYSIAQSTSEFDSEYEASVFQKISDSSEVTPLEIMLALNYEKGNEEKISAEIDRLYQLLDPDKLKTKSTKKQVKTIYQKIHDTKLKKYIVDADFQQLFSTGEYNCVSATALYSLLLDRFGIAYEVRETPTHVYLIADPKVEKILLETTLPQNGTIEFDFKTQKEFVEYLRSNKLISEEEYNSTPIEKLFDKHYDQNKVIDNKKLAALLYYNKGVEQYNSSNFFEASKYLHKSYQIYPSNNIHFLTNYAIINSLAKYENSKEFEPTMLAKFVNLNKEGTEFANAAVSHFQLASNELMVVHPNLTAYRKYYEGFKATVDSTLDISDYELEYNNQISYYYAINRRYPEALQALKISHEINPENLQTREQIFSIAAEHMMDDRSHERNLDSLKKYFNYFPFLEKDERVMMYYNYSQMRVIRENIHYGNVSKGLSKLDDLEASIKANGMNGSFDRGYFAEIYVDLANYYLRQTKPNKATQALKRGLDLDPTSDLLRNRYQSLAKLSSEYNQSQAAIATMSREYEESYEEQFNKYFVACWTYEGVLTREGKEGNYDESFKIMSYKGDKVTYIINGKTKKGKYSLRKKSKLLYLIPDINKDDYTIFKLLQVSPTEMILMPFKNEKLTGERIYMSRC